jgi:hypothetical protein
MNSARLRQRLSVVYASATLAGSRVFHASSAIRAFCAAVSAVKGGSGGRFISQTSFGKHYAFNNIASLFRRCRGVEPARDMKVLTLILIGVLLVATECYFAQH